MNYGNANKSSPMTTQDIIKSYFMAVFASCSTGAAVRAATKPITARSTGGKLVILNAIVSMMACAMGGFANNWFTRMPETVQGIGIEDPATLKTVGISKICAKEAVLQTASSRILMALPVGIPAFVIYAIEKRGFLPKNIVLLTTLQMSLCGVQLMLAAPISMAAFPQICTIPASKLEPEFQNMKSEATGQLISEFRYNKGL